MLFESHKEIMIIAEGSIKLEAKSIRFSSPMNINVVRTAAAAEMQPWIAPIGSMVEGTVVSAAETPADLAEHEGEDGMLEGTLLVL